MKKIDLSVEQKEAQRAFRTFVEAEVTPKAYDYEQKQYIPPEMIAKLAQQRYLGAILPQTWGGQGMDLITYGVLNEELARGSSSVRGLVMLQNMVGYTISKWGSKPQKERWMARLSSGEVIAALAATEPEVGSDIKEVKTTATLDGDTYVLNGHKRWISLGQVAGLYLILGKYNGSHCAFLVERDTPGLLVKPMMDLSGLRATMLAELYLEDCRVPQDNLVGAVGFGLAPVVFTALNLGRYSIAWGCVGISQACLDACLQYTQIRKQFGVYLKEHQLIQRMITNMVVNVKAARLLCLQAGYMTDASDSDAFAETMVAKYFASTAATQIANDAVQILGAVGFQDSHPLQRHLRDARMMEIIEGTTQIHQIKIAENSYRGNKP